ncbi:hypothetical protein Taro_015698, partial [Colocasia esculenta]|nr:hypothetical protein [Colocasia esculenta]
MHAGSSKSNSPPYFTVHSTSYCDHFHGGGRGDTGKNPRLQPRYSSSAFFLNSVSPKRSAMAAAVRELTVLGEFKPFGLIAEVLDGKATPAEGAEAEEDKYDYFLFDPDITRERDESLFGDYDLSTPSTPSSRSEHELFIRGNRIIWSTGSRVHKRYSSSSPVLMACWCHIESISEALLCVLQIDSLSIYSSSGEVVCIPLPHAIASIWSLPFGLLLQKTTDVNHPTYMPYSSSSSLSNSRELSRPSKEYIPSQYTSNLFSSLERALKEDADFLFKDAELPMIH